MNQYCEQPESSPTEELFNEDAAQEELTRMITGLKHDPTLNGIIGLSRDGIYRSLTAEREVVDAFPCRPVLIKASIDRFSFNPKNEIIFRGVDGTKAPREQWYHPDKSLLPPPYKVPEDRTNLLAKEIEKNRRWWEERAERPPGPCAAN